MCDGPLLPSNPFLHIGMGQLSVIWSHVLCATFAVLDPEVFDSVDFWCFFKKTSRKKLTGKAGGSDYRS